MNPAAILTIVVVSFLCGMAYAFWITHVDKN
jgi:hypothetical protein